MEITKETGNLEYGELLASLRERITEGEYLPSKFLGSEYELARQTGLSRNTVRKAVDCLVGERLVERRPRKGLFVADPSKQKLTRVEVVVHHYSRYLNRGLATGASAVAEQMFAEVHSFETGTSYEHALRVIERLPESGFEGAIILGILRPKFFELAYKLKSQGFPFVLVDVRNSPLQVDCVLLDNYGAGRDLATHLLELGHKRIAFIGDLISDSVSERLAGVRDAVLDAGLPFPNELVMGLDVVPLSDWRPEIERSIQCLLELEEMPSAVVFGSDMVAVEAYRILKKKGLSLPRDISIAGFDGEVIGEHIHPTLTTMVQPCDKFGRIALELLLKRIKGDRSPPVEVKLKAELKARESTIAIK